MCRSAGVLVLLLRAAQAFTPPTVAGEVLTLVGSGSAAFADGTGAGASFNYPTGVAVTGDGGLVFVAEQSNNRVRMIHVATQVVTTLAGSGSAAFADGTGAGASFNYPIGVAVTVDGEVVFVAEQNNNRVRMIHVATQAVTTLAGSGSATFADGTGAGASFYQPFALTGDGGVVFVADYLNHRIRMIHVATQVVTTLAGSGSAAFADGTGTGVSFHNPTGVAVTGDGEVVFVADYSNHLVRMIHVATQAVTTLAGSGSAAFADGTGAGASFNYQTSVAVTGDGKVVFVADRDNHRIRAVGTGATSQPTLVPTLMPTQQPTMASTLGTGTCYASTSTVTAMSRNHSRHLNVPITEVQVGDYVLGTDGKHRGKFAKVLSVPCSRSAEDFVDISVAYSSVVGTYGIKQLKATLHHTFPTCKGDIAQAKDLGPGDCLHTISGLGRVESAVVVPATESDKTCSIVLEGARVVAVGGIFTASKGAMAGASSAKLAKFNHTGLRGSAAGLQHEE